MTAEDVRDAEEAADRWLALVDAGDYTHAWDEAAALLKGAIARDAFAASVHAARSTFGDLKSRTRTSSTYATTLPGAPDGEYVVIETSARFDRKQHAVETVTPMKDPDGTWRVSGYFIR